MHSKVVIKIILFLGVIFIAYGILVCTVGSGTGFFVSWLGLGLLLILFAFSLKVGFWKLVPVWIKGILATLFLTGLLVIICFEGMVIRAFEQEVPSGLDVIIVLGAQVYQNGPSRSLQYRLDRAIEYLEENPETICIVSGGQGYNEPFAEAVGMAAYLKDHGITEKRILLEAKSKTTEENIQYCKDMIPEGASIGLVTNNFHIFRALQIAKGQGLKEVSGISAKSTPLFLPNNMFREFFGEVKYLLF
ncbi:MAG: YdcF family protein [Eubacteriales bacterium]|nr:YdcF family protein [Eubacteriales bacterium]